MCGIFGWVFDQPPPATKMGVLAGMLSALNDNRGGHSWGYATPTIVDRGMGTWVSSGKIPDLVCQSLVMAHARYQTTGEKKVEHAHPFRFGNIIGAHNGGVYNYRNLNKEFDRSLEVDSMHIFAHLAENEPLDRDFEGYGAIEYMDTRAKKGVFLAEHHGDLAVARIHKMKGYIWSSSADHLKAALHAAGFDYRPMALESSIIYFVSPDGLARLKKRFKFISGGYRTSSVQGWNSYNHSSGGLHIKPTVRESYSGSRKPPEKKDKPPVTVTVTDSKGNKTETDYETYMMGYGGLYGQHYTAYDQYVERERKEKEEKRKQEEKRKLESWAGGTLSTVALPKPVGPSLSEIKGRKRTFQPASTDCAGCGRSRILCLVCSHCTGCCISKPASRDAHAAAKLGKEQFPGNVDDYVSPLTEEPTTLPAVVENSQERRSLSRCSFCDLSAEHTCSVCTLCFDCCKEFHDEVVRWGMEGVLH